jgi:hypothetical protein
MAVTYAQLAQLYLSYFGRPAVEVLDFSPVRSDYSRPIQVQDTLVTWPGKDRGEPKPPIIWAPRQEK